MVDVGTKHAGGARADWLFIVSLFLNACASSDAPVEPYARSAGGIVSERRTGARAAPPPDFVRARLADDAARRYATTHPVEPIRPPTEAELLAQRVEAGMPDARFLADPRLAIRVGMLVADVTFLSAGTRDVYMLDPAGRFPVPTTRYRVRVDAAVRGSGLPTVHGETDIFAPVGFAPPSDPSGGAPRMLMVLGDHSLRPGFNVKVATSIDRTQGRVISDAFGAPPGAVVAEVLHGLEAEARAGGAS